MRPDALIIADPAIFTIAGEVCPDIDRHISTQANNTNYGTFQFWEKLGATRVVTARELSLREIRQIREHISDDLEKRHLYMALCVFPTREGVCCPIILQEGMPTAGHVHIRAGGNILWLKRRNVRVSIFRFMKMSGEPIFSIPKICV